MKLIVGLGNPGEKYKNTRHNVGFLVLDRLVISDKVTCKREWKFSKSANADYINIDNKIEFFKPKTFMNLSGQAVQYAMQKNRVKLQDVLIVCDDLDLPLGTVRIRMEGSSGGHNGLQSIIDHIGNKFTRIRIGIGSNREIQNSKPINQLTNQPINRILAEDYVLQNFTKNEIKIIDKSVDKTAEILLEWTGGKELEEKTVKVEAGI